MSPCIGQTALLAPAPAVQRRSNDSFQVIVRDDLRSLAGTWPRTDKSSPADYHVFQCADLLEVWCRTIGTARGTQPLFVAVHDDDRLLMLLPLGIERRRGLRVLTFLDGDVCDYNAPVIFPDGRDLDADDVRKIWRGIRSALPPFDVAQFDKMPADIDGTPNPLLALGAWAHAPSAYVVTLAGGWKEFAENRLPRRRHTLRKRRRLADLGSIEFVIASTPAERQRLLDVMIRQKSRRYMETLGVNRFDDAGFRDYFTEMTFRFGNGGAVHLSALQVDGEIVAAHWGLLVRNHFYHLMPSYAEGDWSRFSPGRLLLEHLMEWCFAHGVKVFDFGVGDESYKLEYRDRDVPLYRTVIPVTVAGHAFSAAAKARRQIKSTLKDTKAWSVLRRLSPGRPG